MMRRGDCGGGCEDGWMGMVGKVGEGRREEERGRERKSVGNKRRIGVMCRHRTDVGSTFLEDFSHQIKKQKSNS